MLVAVFLLQGNAAAQSVPRAPQIAVRQIGATIESVTIETYGTIKPSAVRPFLSLHSGSSLEQDAVDRDFDNLVTFGGYRVRLQIGQGNAAKGVTLRWIVMAPWFRIAAPPFYSNPPLLNPAGGLDIVISSPQIDEALSHIKTEAALNLYGRRYYAGFQTATQVNAKAGREADFIANYLGEQNIVRLNTAVAVTTYDWTDGAQALYLLRGTRGTQLEIGLREERSIGRVPSGISAPSVYPITVAAARNALIEAGVSHACKIYSQQCKIQYRFAVIDGIGGFGATSRFQEYRADIARYVPVRTSTLAFRAFEMRTGGVVPESRLACTFGLRGYPIVFCGTDAQVFQAEYRIRDAALQKLKFVLFTETGSTRVRSGSQPWALPNFQWHADSGAGIRYRGLALDAAYGSNGIRVTFTLENETF